MSKSLYSLMLPDEVVSAVDRLALKSGMNRSQLVARILAEHLSLLTPERRIEQILQQVDRFFAEEAEMVSQLMPHQPSMQIKTALSYRYRPTIRYDLRLYREPEDGAVGELSMTLRTQAEDLLTLMESFFASWIPLEQAVLKGRGAPRCRLQPGRFIRSIALPAEETDAGRFSEAITNYVQLLDTSFKDYIGGRLDESDLAYRLQEYAKGETV